MSASVLGKRGRDAADIADAPARSTRAKRRAVLVATNDENANPIHIENGVVEEIDVPCKASAKGIRVERAAPAKHGKPEQRVVISPAGKIHDRFKVSKVSVDVYQDGKNLTPPATPRHRDAPGKRVPVTPRHRLIVAGAQSTPRTPSTPSSGATAIYNQARQVFSRCANPGRLTGRAVERSELSGFIDRCIASQAGGCLYVSGPPGTGKSALVDEVCQTYSGAEQLSVSTVNCMSVRSTKDLTSKLAVGLDLEEDAGFDYLRSCFVGGKTQNTGKYIVVLDEIDRLVDLDLALLYNMFEWSLRPASRLILIGIANALDLTDRFLPRLKSRNLQPDLLPIMPYNAAQIAEVLTARLKSLPGASELDMPAFLHPAAIQFCAKKVASQTGDLRKAFDICRRAIDLVAQKTKEKDMNAPLQDSPSKTPLMENINLSSPPSKRSPVKSPFKFYSGTTQYTLATAPKATIAHMAMITSQVFSTGTTQRLSTLNLQQKAVLCALAALEKHKRATQLNRAIFATPSKGDKTAPTIKRLHESYSSLCKRSEMLQPLSSVDFRDIVSGLETLGLVANADGRNGSFAVAATPSKTPGRKSKTGFGGPVNGDERRVSSAVGEKEIRASLEGVAGELLREILDGNCQH